jgi:FMN reductase
MSAQRPLVVGIGGSGRPGSTTDRALILALAGAEREGARTRLFDGAFLASLPLFLPWQDTRTPQIAELLDALTEADGLVLATPSYHGGVSGLVKNALDYLEDLRADYRPYLDGRAVGCVVTSAGRQAGGTTLSGLWSLVHALRGWPTPLGVTVDTTQGGDLSPYAGKLGMVGRQVAWFAQATSSTAPVPVIQ